MVLTKIIGLLLVQKFMFESVDTSSIDGMDKTNFASADIFASDAEIKDTFTLLEQGEREIEISDRYRDITLILGNTGAGKSTFLHWLTGNDGKLRSVSVRGLDYSNEDEGEYIIKDENGKIGSSITSQTIFPERLIDKETDSAFYDCPGFSDTRSVSFDIGTTYFIKKLTDHAEKIKMIFVVSHSSVTVGVDRQDFMRVMKHATELIKNIDKFKNSIALIVTKVDRADLKSELIIKRIVNYLQEVQRSLRNELSNSDLTDEKRNFYEKSIVIIDILLTSRSGKDFLRIGLFRRPNKSGPISKIPLLESEKQRIKTLIYKNLNSTLNENGDFGYTISDRSKNIISGLVNEINKNVWNNTKTIAEKLQSSQKSFTNKMFNKLNSIANSEEIIRAEKYEAHMFADEFNKGQKAVTQLVQEFEILTNINELGRKISEATSILKDDNFDEQISIISNQTKYLNFLQTMSDKKFSMSNLVDLFIPIEQSFAVLKENIRKTVENIAGKISLKIENEMRNVRKEIEHWYLDKVERLEIDNSLFELNQGHQIISHLNQEISKSNTPFQISELINRFISKLKISSSIIKRSMSSYGLSEKYLQFLEIVRAEKLDINPSSWVKSVDELGRFLSDSENW